MEEIKKYLMLIATNSDLKIVHGIKALTFKEKCLIFIWCDNKIHIYEINIPKNQEESQELFTGSPKKSELTLKNSVIDIFRGDNFVYVLVENGVFHLLQLNTNNPGNYMEVEDLFSSPTTSECTSEWKETTVKKVSECERIINACHLTSSIAILSLNDEHLTVLAYSLTELQLKFVVNLKKYQCKEGVLSSCVISLMSPSLKQQFKNNLEVFDEEIIIVGLASGLLLWFCTNNPHKGPFVLFNTHQEMQSIHWIKDSRSGQYIYLLTILKSGQIVFFGEEKYSALYLPDSVKSSYCLNNYVITSNFVDCYASEIKMDKNITMNFVVLPVKGVCAMTCAPSCDNLLIAATTHGSVYCLNPTLVPPENSTLFTLPDQSLLDNMFLQSQNLDSLYKQLNFEEDILKAVSAAVAANSGKNLFETTVKVISDHIFCITAGIRDSKLTFLSTLWSACVEIIDEGGQKKTSFHKIESDFSSNSNLIVNVNDSLSVNDVVSIELVYFIEKVQPLLIIPVGKIKIDACHLMCSQMTTESTVKIEETLKDILDDMESEQPKLTQSECKVIIKLPADYPVNSFFKTILASSQQRFTSDEWEKLSSGRKLNISVCISNFIVLLKLEIESRQLIIISNSTKLCHQVKEAVAIRLKSSVKKCIPENITLDLQAIHQTFEIESLYETPSEERLQSLKTNLRSSISSELII